LAKLWGGPDLAAVGARRRRRSPSGVRRRRTTPSTPSSPRATGARASSPAFGSFLFGTLVSSRSANLYGLFGFPRLPYELCPLALCLRCPPSSVPWYPLQSCGWYAWNASAAVSCCASVSTACSSCCSTWFGHRCLTAPPLWIWLGLLLCPLYSSFLIFCLFGVCS
jgi:hypothetical protein